MISVKRPVKNKHCAQDARLCSNLINKLQPRAISAVASLGQKLFGAKNNLQKILSQ